MVEDTWSDDLILHICRMTDPGADVLTVRLLPKLVKVALRDDVKSRLDKVDIATAFARDWRDLRIAHRNKELVLNPSAKPLANADAEAFTTAILALDQLLHFVNHHFFKTEPSWYEGLETLGGASSILSIVDAGLKYRDQQSRSRSAEHPLTEQAAVRLSPIDCFDRRAMLKT